MDQPEGSGPAGTNLTDATLSGADLRGPDMLIICEGGLEGALNADDAGIVWVACSR